MDSQQLKQARLDKKLLSNVSKMPAIASAAARGYVWAAGLPRSKAAHAKTATPARACITCPTSRPR